ncbi:MAG TPA: biotin/lipoyl-containing protein [Thermoanaerobaculia bacterium]|nr:biotin/lipoyl-containing protein [Thermoanaerobaculia bacterium]
MELIVRHGEREERVQVRRSGDGFEVTVGDRTYPVDALAAGRLIQSLRIDGAHHEVAVRAQGDGTYWVSTAYGAGPVEVTDPLTHLAAQAAGGRGGRKNQRMNAYMPGRVVAVLAEEGQTVTAGQGIVVLEAMKMENEIRAEHDGVLRHIFVQPGQSVDGGDPLFELE